MSFNQIKFKSVLVVLVWLGPVFVDSGLQTHHKLNPSALSVWTKSSRVLDWTASQNDGGNQRV